MTTKVLRKNDFEFIVASNDHGEASGSLYIDDGESLVQAASTQVKMSFKKGKLDLSGGFGFKTGDDRKASLSDCRGPAGEELHQEQHIVTKGAPFLAPDLAALNGQPRVSLSTG